MNTFISNLIVNKYKSKCHVHNSMLIFIITISICESGAIPGLRLDLGLLKISLGGAFPISKLTFD